MDSEDNLWVVPKQIDPDLDLTTIDPDDEDALRDYEVALAACQSATHLLWALSGRKYHTGTLATEQYYADRSYVPSWSTPIFPGSTVAGLRFTTFLIDRVDFQASRVRLCGVPVKAIGSVTDIATGKLISPDNYTLVNRSTLHFETMPVKGVDVSYTYGQLPPTIGRMAALQLAKNFYYLWSGREDQCKFPERVTSVTRQGVSWVLLDSQDFIEELKTGLYAVDLFLKMANPAKATQKAKVFSIDMPRGRRRSL